MDIFVISVCVIVTFFQLLGSAARVYKHHQQRKQRREQFNRLYSDLLGGVTHD